MKYLLSLVLLLVVSCGGSSGGGGGGGKSETGFVVRRDGFGFPNYGRNVPSINLTNAQAARLCGSTACVRGSGDTCVLSSPTEAFIRYANKVMEGGHCFGMAVLSEAIFQGSVPLTSLDFNASNTFGLPFSGTVQEQIAYYFSTQLTNPAAGAALKNLTPNDILGLLRNPGSESYSLAIFKPDFSQGHAVTAIKVIDDSATSSRIQIYDNNYTGTEQFIHVDRAANNWDYGPYQGQVGQVTMFVNPLSASLLQQRCPMQGNADDADAVTSLDWQVAMTGDGHLTNLSKAEKSKINVVSDPQNEDSPEPILVLTPGFDYTMNIDGTSLAQVSPTEIAFHRAGHAIRVEDIFLEPGQTDTVKLGAEGRSLVYTSTHKELVTLRVGASYHDSDYEIAVRPQGQTGAMSIEVLNEIDFVSGNHALRVKNIDGGFTGFRIHVRHRAEFDDEFDNTTTFAIAQGECVHVNYGIWTSDGQELSLTRDPGCDGHALNNLTLPDNV